MKARAAWAISAVGIGTLAFAGTTLAQGDTIPILTPEGQSTATLECSCSELPFVGCARGHRVDKVVLFVLPEGYQRGQFSSEVQPGGLHAGGRVTWATDDPHNASINLHCWADAYSKAKVTVSGVTARRE